jgi:adenylate kinase
MIRVILLGPPGSGKGTQGDLVGKKYSYPKISTGDILRLEVKEGTPLGKKAKAVMDQGDLVSDDIVVEIVKKRILHPDCSKGYVLDGFPRNVSQAQGLEEMEGNRAEIVLNISLTEKALISRLSARRVCFRCGAVYNLLARHPKKDGSCDVCQSKLIQRQDDRPGVIKERLRVYHRQTEPLIDYYKEKKVYHRIDGEGTIEAVFDEISSILDRDIIQKEEVDAAR